MRRFPMVVLFLVAAVPATGASLSSGPLTADEAVKIALQHNTRIVQAEAGRYTARSDMWSAYSGVLPRLSADVSRSGSFTRESRGSQAFGTNVFPSTTFDAEGYSTTQSVTGTWNLINLSSWTNFSAARLGQKSAQYSLIAARSAVELSTRQQFYQVVQAMHLARVNAQALRLARDSERRVRAMYEVGSVSKSDLLKAQVATSQAQLDSLTSNHNVTGQRILLAQQLGLPEMQLAEVDSSLTFTAQTVDAASVLADAHAHRPDLRAAEANARASELDLRGARWARLPYVSLSGSWSPDSRRSSKFFHNATTDTATSSASETKGAYNGSVALNFDFFDGLATDARIAAARGQVMNARETRDALLRNLEGEVHQAVLGYQEAAERIDLATRTVESASENQNLVQQKYNVGSATILDLIDSQVQLQRAQSNLVSAKAAIRIAEAQLDQVRGRSQ